MIRTQHHLKMATKGIWHVHRSNRKIMDVICQKQKLGERGRASDLLLPATFSSPLQNEQFFNRTWLFFKGFCSGVREGIVERQRRYKKSSVYTKGVLDLIRQPLCRHNERNTVPCVMWEDQAHSVTDHNCFCAHLHIASLVSSPPAQD